MMKHKESLIESEMESTTQEKSWTSPYASPEILKVMRRLEAREWIARWRQKAQTDGASSSNAWWRKTILDIERIRGRDAAIELRNLMNEERNK